jgi:hypothetical protein
MAPNIAVAAVLIDALTPTLRPQLQLHATELGIQHTA